MSESEVLVSYSGYKDIRVVSGEPSKEELYTAETKMKALLSNMLYYAAQRIGDKDVVLPDRFTVTIEEETDKWDCQYVLRLVKE